MPRLKQHASECICILTSQSEYLRNVSHIETYSSKQKVDVAIYLLFAIITRKVVPSLAFFLNIWIRQFWNQQPEICNFSMHRKWRRMSRALEAKMCSCSWLRVWFNFCEKEANLVATAAYGKILSTISHLYFIINFHPQLNWWTESSQFTSKINSKRFVNHQPQQVTILWNKCKFSNLLWLNYTLYWFATLCMSK